MNEKQSVMAVINEVKKAIIGKDDCIIKVMASILAGGHVLIEDIPGVGKTTMALSFSQAMNLSCHRVQFTPDILPADINGFSLYNKDTGTFVYQPGSIMCNIFLADEINRTSPKTQSALLEVMEEGFVTVDGVSRKVPDPFIVIATQNPSGSAGTQLLPESQLDRFMLCLSMGYPDMKDEIAIVKGKSRQTSVSDLCGVLSAEDLLIIKQEVCDVYIQDSLYTYIGNLVQATRQHPMIELGVSPRGTIALAKMSKAYAYLCGRTYVLPEDILSIVNGTLLHRIILNVKARINHVNAQAIFEEIINSIKRPSVRKE